MSGSGALNQRQAGEDNREDAGRFQPEEERFGPRRGTLIPAGGPGRATRAQNAQVGEKKKEAY
ncbi:MAG: hypothetical protein V3S68_09340 [Dehalococcoidia bacterium]